MLLFYAFVLFLSFFKGISFYVDIVPHFRCYLLRSVYDTGEIINKWNWFIFCSCPFILKREQSWFYSSGRIYKLRQLHVCRKATRRSTTTKMWCRRYQCVTLEMGIPNTIHRNFKNNKSQKRLPWIKWLCTERKSSQYRQRRYIHMQNNRWKKDSILS